MKRVALYARVSTGGQTVENQLRELEQVGSRIGWQVVDRYIDQGISGAKGRAERPELARMMRAVIRGELDVVAAWSVDRLGRSLQELVSLLNELRERRVDLYLHQQGLDTGTPSGRAMYQMLGVFAEFERAIIIERIKAGMTRARAQGKRLSRPLIPKVTAERIRELRTAGMSLRRIADEVGVSKSTVANYLPPELQKVRSAIVPS
ncbi:MAG: recombinase family protein [Rhodocyclaceae bacterium]|uniref:Resolvase n=1 Tax=metagenome TaxID=256318 RepID=A0A380THT8_9ZZZZ|nr:recombinase family protein [Rhodocyclaceae bacterium]SUS07738.1 Resolvase [uncultured Defluviicoccus sp.]